MQTIVINTETHSVETKPSGRPERHEHAAQRHEHAAQRGAPARSLLLGQSRGGHTPPGQFSWADLTPETRPWRDPWPSGWESNFFWIFSLTLNFEEVCPGPGAPRVGVRRGSSVPSQTLLTCP